MQRIKIVYILALAVTVRGGGLTDEFKNAPWEKFRDEIYRGHGA